MEEAREKRLTPVHELVSPSRVEEAVPSAALEMVIGALPKATKPVQEVAPEQETVVVGVEPMRPLEPM